MPKRTREYNPWRLEKLTNPETAASYLTAAITDSPEMFRKALRNVAQARQMARVARSAGVTRESLYRATSEIGNPTLDTLDAVLTAVGVKIIFRADRDSVSSVLPQPNSTISGFRTGHVNLVTEEKTRQGIGNTVGVTYSTDIGNSLNGTFQLGQGNKELWLQKMTLQHSLTPPSILEGQMTLPPATQTTYNLNQPSGM